MRPLLGTYVEVWARGPSADAALEAAFASLERSQACWSFHDASSELSRLNAQPQRRVKLAPRTLRLLRAARAVMRASGGAFDCTVGGTLVELGILPNHGGPLAMPRGSAADIEIGTDWALLRRPVRLTLDGIAKGYAVDLALHALRCNRACAGWVNAGGDMRVFGDVAVQVHRRELAGNLMPLGALRNAALASSRSTAHRHPDAESFPGYIVGTAGAAPEPGVWSVLARSAWRADALTKVAANVADAHRVHWIRKLGGSLLSASGVPA